MIVSIDKEAIFYEDLVNAIALREASSYSSKIADIFGYLLELSGVTYQSALTLLIRAQAASKITLGVGRARAKLSQEENDALSAYEACVDDVKYIVGQIRSGLLIIDLSGDDRVADFAPDEYPFSRDLITPVDRWSREDFRAAEECAEFIQMLKTQWGREARQDILDSVELDQEEGAGFEARWGRKPESLDELRRGVPEGAPLSPQANMALREFLKQRWVRAS